MGSMGTVETGSSQQGEANGWENSGARRRQPTRRSGPTQIRTYDGPRAAKGPNEKLADFLGWFSIGLGASQIVMPRVVSKICGVDDSDGNTTLMRTLGMREVASGVGILSQDRPTTWLWARRGRPSGSGSAEEGDQQRRKSPRTNELRHRQRARSAGTRRAGGSADRELTEHGRQSGRG